MSTPNQPLDLAAPSDAATVKFWSHVTKTETCWLWDCSISRYGTLSVNGRGVGAHRFSFILHNGPIPDGLFVLHKCDVRACVRPDHLFLAVSDIVPSGPTQRKNDAEGCSGKIRCHRCRD